MLYSNETVSSACRRLAAAGIDLVQLRTVIVDTTSRDEGAIRLIALFGALRQGDLTVLFGVSKVTTSRLVAHLVASKQLHTSACPDGARGRPATWLLLPGTALPSIAERQAIATLVNDAAIVLQATGQGVQFPKDIMAIRTKDTCTAPTVSAPPHRDSAAGPMASSKEGIQLELPELPAPEDRLSNLTPQLDTACLQEPQSSAAPPWGPTAADTFGMDPPRSQPSPTSLPTTRMEGNVPVECPRPVQVTPASPPSWPATTQQVWPTRGSVARSLPSWETFAADITPRPAAFTRQPARDHTPAVPLWQRQSSRAHVYLHSIIRSVCAWHAVGRTGSLRTRLGHWFSTVGRWLLLHLQCFARGIWHALRCLGRGILGTIRYLGAVIDWITDCIAVLYKLTDQRIWPAMLVIVLLVGRYLMFSLIQSLNVMSSTEVAPVSATSPTQLSTPTTGYRLARVAGTEGVGLLIRDTPNGKRRLGDGLQEGATVMVIAGPVTTADAQNPIWWNVRYNSVTGWVSGRFLTFTDQAP